MAIAKARATTSGSPEMKPAAGLEQGGHRVDQATAWIQPLSRLSGT